MSQKMTREELVDLVETITTMRNKSTNELLSEKEIHALVLKFEKIQIIQGAVIYYFTLS